MRKHLPMSVHEMDRQDRETRAAAVYRVAYEAAAGDDDDRDQAGFAAIEAAFSNLSDTQQLDLLQHAQETMAGERMAS